MLSWSIGKIDSEKNQAQRHGDNISRRKSNYKRLNKSIQRRTKATKSHVIEAKDKRRTVTTGG